MDNSIFSGTYWSHAVGELKKIRMLTFAALICALSIVVGAFYVVVGENLRVYFTFFITAVGCAVYGPVMGMLVAAVTDTLNFLMFPSGPYFPGYMLGEMVGALIYGLALYRKKISVFRLFLSKLGVNYCVNVFLGCLWSKMLYGQGYLYYLVKSVIKNTLLLPFEVIALCGLFSVLIPAFSRFGLLPVHEDSQLARLKMSRSVFPVLGISAILAGVCSLYYSISQSSGRFGFQLLGAGMMILGLGLLIWGSFFKKSMRSRES